MVFDILDGPEDFWKFWAARDDAVEVGLRTFAPGIIQPLEEMGDVLWDVVEQLPVVGRVMFGSLLALDRPRNPLLAGWHAVNCLREWRGDTHWAIVVAAGLTHSEASILHNAWLGYEDDWLSRSRGNTPEQIEQGWADLTLKGLADARKVSPAGIQLRQEIEDSTDALTVLPWRLIGEDAAWEFSERFEPPCELLLTRVDDTAGPNYQPASRIRRAVPNGEA
jgi:hypothetical protein